MHSKLIDQKEEREAMEDEALSKKLIEGSTSGLLKLISN